MKTCTGAYACLAMLAGFGLIVFRDPNGIRPAGVAVRQGTRGGNDYLIASESVVAQGLGFNGWEDVKAGEAVIITRNGISRRVVGSPGVFCPDIFEFVYFARPDSTIDGISVYRSRMAMGDSLAETVKNELKKAKIEVDVVIPVPDTARVSALQLAQHLGIPYREGFVKNRYVGRTFIMPGQQQRSAMCLFKSLQKLTISQAQECPEKAERDAIGIRGEDSLISRWCVHWSHSMLAPA